jgi:CheY-like chemotaxis protein
MIEAMMNDRPRILIVEDDAAVGNMIEDYLNAAGYETARALDGREAVQLVRELRPDAVVMDLMMPRLTGGEAARQLRDDPLTSHIPIVAISAVADVTTIAELLPLDVVLPKPFDMDELVQALVRVMPVALDPGGDEQPHP